MMITSKESSRKKRKYEDDEDSKSLLCKKSVSSFNNIAYFGGKEKHSVEEMEDIVKFDANKLWKSVEKKFMICTGGINPRDHQVEAVCRVSAALMNDAYKLRSINYLLQHATGSGKSLTVASLVYQLLHLRFSPASSNQIKEEDPAPANGIITADPGFRLVLLLNDRLQLDSQLSEVVESFLLEGGIAQEEIVKAYNTNILEHVLKRLNKKSKSALDFERTGSKPLPRVVFSTIQKFPSLERRSGEDDGKIGRFSNILRHGRIAIIADEAHRSHGKSITAQINGLFGENPKTQPLGLVYISLTATPSHHALKLFGLPREIGKRKVYAPFHHYSMLQSIADGNTLNVLLNYETLTPKVEWKLPAKSRFRKNKGLTALEAAAVAYNKKVLDFKAKFILKTFLKIVLKYKQRTHNSLEQPFQPKAMMICRSRRHVLEYTQILRDFIEEKQESIKNLEMYDESDELHGQRSRPSVYGAYSGDVKMTFDVDEDGDKGISESGLNSGLRLKDADIIVVCSKLETGYNEPKLGVMFVDRLLQGSKAVQVLSRLNRTCPGKDKTEVFDFVNTVDQIREAFAEYWNETTWAGRGEFTENGAEAEIEYELNMKLDFIVSSILGSIEGVKNLTPKEAAERILLTLEGDRQESISQGLEKYIEICSQLSIQKLELPFAFAAHLYQRLRPKKEESEQQTMTAEEIQELAQEMKVDIKGTEVTHSGEIKILSPSQLLPTQKMTEKERKASEKLTLAKMVENSYLRGGGASHIKSLLNVIMNPDTQSTSDSSICLNVLRRLDLADMTLHYLQETKAGQIVAALKKHPDKAVSSLARTLVKRWKKLWSPTAPLPVSGVGDGSSAEANKREGLIHKLIEALSKPVEEDVDAEKNESKIRTCAKEIEKEMFVFCSGATKEYTTKLRSLKFNLQDKKNMDLRIKVLERELEASKLVRMGSDELANKEVASMRKEIKKKKMEELEKWTASQDSLGNSSDYTCASCNSTRCYVNGTGTRGGWVSSQIEPSIIVTCCDCNNRWEAN